VIVVQENLAYLKVDVTTFDAAEARRLTGVA